MAKQKRPASAVLESPKIKTHAKAATGIDTQPLKVAGQHLHRQVEQGRLPGYMSYVLKDGQTVHFEAFGHADLAAGEMMRLETLFRLYSQTKPFLVVGFLILYERGIVDLHDPISKFLPEFEAAVVGAKRLPLVRPISVHDLLAHTSGIGFGPGFGYDPENAYESSYVPLVRKVDLGEIQSLAEWCQELAKIPLRFQPGRDWGYGYSSDVLGRLLEVAAGQPLEQFLRSEILSPLNLSETFFQVPKNRAGALAALYKREPWHGISSSSDAVP